METASARVADTAAAAVGHDAVWRTCGKVQCNGEETSQQGQPMVVSRAQSFVRTKPQITSAVLTSLLFRPGYIMPTRVTLGTG